MELQNHSGQEISLDGAVLSGPSSGKLSKSQPNGKKAARNADAQAIQQYLEDNFDKRDELLPAAAGQH